MKLSRRLLLPSFAAWAFAGGARRPAFAEPEQIWGALRWDAWWGASADALAGQKDLWPRKWQFRAPAWAKVEGPNKLAFAPSQEAMDAEIEAAARAGLAYWAYDYYPTSVDHDFMTALAFHRKSRRRAQVKYALILQLGHWGGDDEFAAVNDTIAGFASDDFYLCTNGRPVVFLLWNPAVYVSRFGSRAGLVAARLADLRRRVEAAAKRPSYVALMTPVDARMMREIGADALANYAVGPRVGNVPIRYADYDRYVRARWRAMLETGAEIVPTAMTGWDMRPIAEDPPPWYRSAVRENVKRGFVEPASPAEFAEHMRAAVTFVRDHPEQCRERLGLIYSWDECSEGGNVLAPTLGAPKGRLLPALASVLS